MNPTNPKSLKELLDRLSVESWQLELVVSGFAIFLTGSSIEPVRLYGSRLFVISEGLNTSFSFFELIGPILLGSLFFVFINLILHIIIRGMWISAIGLRSVSGEIDFKQLKFARPFNSFLQKKLKSFDAFIQRLDDISSVIFAFTFLLVFMIISFGLFFIFMGSIIYLLNEIQNGYDLGGADWFMVVSIIILLLLFLSGLLYLIDFATLGFLKRKRWIAVWYYPIYRLFSVVTFSWLYRPLYYNLIDNKFGRRVGLFLFPYFIVVAFLTTTRATINLYIPEEKEGFQIIDRYFADKRSDKKRIVDISVPSMYIDNGFLELFILYYASNDDESIKALCPDLTPDVISGIGTELEFNVNRSEEDKYKYSPVDSLLGCVAKNFEVRVDDSLYQNLTYFFYEDQAFGQQGVKTVIDLNHLERGPHQLEISRYELVTGDSLVLKSFAKTPVWLE